MSTRQKPDPVTIPATKAHRNFGELVRRAYRGEDFIVEKDGLPVVVLISIAEYQEFQQLRERIAQDTETRVQNFRKSARAIGEEFERLGITEENMEVELEKIRQQQFEERYGKHSTSS